MEIRRACREDIPRILELLSQVLEVHAKLRPDLFASGTTKYNQAQLEDMVNDDMNPIFVAEIDNEVVGYAFCQLRIPSGNMYPVRVLHLDDLCVDEKYRQQHIGQQLFKFVLEEAKRRGCYEITLNSWNGNEAATKFYEKMGLKTRSRILEYIL